MTPGSYLLVADGIMADVAGSPRAPLSWTEDNPQQAVLDFLRDHSDFALVEPAPLFNEASANCRATYWPGGFLRRVR